MAGLWCEDWESYPTKASALQGAWAQIDSSGWDLSTANPGTGSQNIRCVNTHSDVEWIRRILGGAKSQAGYGFRVYVDYLPSVENAASGIRLIEFLDAAAACSVCLVLGTDGSIVAYTGASFSGDPSLGTLIARSVPCMAAGSYNHIEASCAPAASGGTVEVRVNGVTRINFTGDTIGLSAGEVSQVATSGPSSATGTTYMDIDDNQAWDTLAGQGPQDFVGNSAVVHRTLTADSTPANWDLSTGDTGYTLLIDQSDATYISAPDTDDRISAFNAGALSEDVTGVVYQQVNFRGLKVGAGDCDVTPGFVSGGDRTDLTPQVMTTGEAWYWGILAEDPASSGAAWTVDSASASNISLIRSL